MISTSQSLEVLSYESQWIDGLNSGDVTVANKVFHQDAIIHINGAPQRDLSVEAFKQMVSGFLAGFPDLHFTVEDQFVSEHKVSTRWIAVGTNTGPLGDMPPTGKRVKVDGLIIDYLEDDKVRERWEQWDQMGMLQQIGVF